MNYGTKANNLYKMREANINVPYFIVLSWEQLVGQDFDISELQAGLGRRYANLHRQLI